MMVNPMHSFPKPYSVSRDCRAEPAARRRGVLLLSVAALVLAGCAVSPQPLTLQERKERIATDKALMRGEIEPVKAPITLEEAMARAIKYNLDHRAELMNDAVTGAQLQLAHYDMLPKLAAAAGYNSRNSDLASESESILTHTQSLEPSRSQERSLLSSQLSLTWNVLDFGVSYIRAKQMADRRLMAEEQRRRVIQNIIQDVRYAYWRAVAADRLIGRLEPLTRRTEAALADARNLEKKLTRAPLEELQYQRALLGTLERLKALRRDLIAAKTQLAALMNLWPGTEFTLAPPGDDHFPVPKLAAQPREMEEVALLNRPELMQASYQGRISHAETTRILLEMLPGVNLGVSGNYDSNRFTVNNAWASYGVNFAWSLLTLASTPARLDVADADRKLIETKRAALSMAVLAQVDVAFLRYEQAVDEFGTANDQADVEKRIHTQLINAGLAQQVGELAVIQAEADDVFAVLRRDTAYANLQNAYGGVLVSIGADPMPDAVADYQVGTLAQAIGATLRAWEDGSSLRGALERLKAADKAVADKTAGDKTAGDRAGDRAGDAVADGKADKAGTTGGLLAFVADVVRTAGPAGQDK